MDADARSFCSQLDFKGFMLSDWAALVSGIPPALAGVDMNMPGFIGYGNGPQDEEDPAVSTRGEAESALICLSLMLTRFARS